MQCFLLPGNIGEDHRPETHLIPLIIQAALGQRDSVSIFGTDYPTPDGTCLRDYIHVKDLASAHVLAMNHLKRAAPAECTTWGRRMVSPCGNHRNGEEGHRPQICVKEEARRAGDPGKLILLRKKSERAPLNPATAISKKS